MIDYVCADCGYEQSSANACDQCLGCRIIAISFAEVMFGLHWRKAFLSPDHPNALKQEDLPPGVSLNN